MYKDSLKSATRHKYDPNSCHVELLREVRAAERKLLDNARVKSKSSKRLHQQAVIHESQSQLTKILDRLTRLESRESREPRSLHDTMSQIIQRLDRLESKLDSPRPHRGRGRGRGRGQSLTSSTDTRSEL